MPCTVCNQNGHNRSTCPIAMSQGVKKKQYKSREEVREFRECPRGYRPVRMGDGTIVLMKHEELYPEKVLCECGVRVSAVDRRALLRHQSTKGHLEWASREYAARCPAHANSTPPLSSSTQQTSAMRSNGTLISSSKPVAPAPVSALDRARRMNQFKKEFVKEDDVDDAAKKAGKALTALTTSSSSEDCRDPSPPISTRVVQRPIAGTGNATAHLVTTAALPGSLSPTSSATSQPEVSHATGHTAAGEPGEPPTSWETQGEDKRWEERNNPAFTSHWLGPSYAANASARGHITHDPMGPNPIELKPPPVLPSFTFETDGFNIAHSLVVDDVASLAPASSLPTAEELYGAEKYGSFGY